MTDLNEQDVVLPETAYTKNGRRRRSDFKNEIGHRYGRLLVTSFDPSRDVPYWICECDCGKTISVNGYDLRGKVANVKSCGCFGRELLSKKEKTHGMTNSKEFKIWSGLKNRCLNPNQPRWKNYGGRGITVCPEWEESFEKFYADMGKCPPGKSLDRENNDLGYSPDNCRWATPKQQAENRRSTVFIEAFGQTMNRKQWATVLGISPSCITFAMKESGLTLEEYILKRDLSHKIVV